MRTSFRHQSEAQPPNSPLTQRGEFVVTSPDIEPMKFSTRNDNYSFSLRSWRALRPFCRCLSVPLSCVRCCQQRLL
jgi:hypothetical protein